ncbi:hypothetical protein Halha_1380 [Halobacteroides halobius DSM 5150]|uniref:PrcB C-terminal domain-containing protein n=1 Tax=Halobacteroides halobius (strain ATCC 35273 / DSM 5150 / MD-1) TaxID=748449 RepID=L0K9Y2_HALHC|nr:protease complex subunit PrcB family protein [Halobacteroides halobius]AGB41325.1 hypothetical protein Halha_1380 [Halobacteroides halobius DSM 5150]
MKYKIIILNLLIVLAISGCNLRQGKVIYNNTEKLEGRKLSSESIKQGQMKLITPNSIGQLRNKLRGIENLSLNNRIAVYASLGERSSGGFQIKIKEIRKKDDNLIVTVKAVGPSPNQAVIQMITYPYDIVELSLKEKEIKKVFFLTPAEDKLKMININ